MENIKKYSNGDITVIWKPDVCIHSGNCVKGLSKVFNPKNRPWIKIHSATSDEIINTVNNCPSGALTYERNENMTDDPKAVQPNQPKTKVQVFKGGPYMVEGPCTIVDKDGNEIRQRRKNFSLPVRWFKKQTLL